MAKGVCSDCCTNFLCRLFSILVSTFWAPLCAVGSADQLAGAARSGWRASGEVMALRYQGSERYVSGGPSANRGALWAGPRQPYARHSPLCQPLAPATAGVGCSTWPGEHELLRDGSCSTAHGTLGGWRRRACRHHHGNQPACGSAHLLFRPCEVLGDVSGHLGLLGGPRAPRRPPCPLHPHCLRLLPVGRPGELQRPDSIPDQLPVESGAPPGALNLFSGRSVRSLAASGSRSCVGSNKKLQGGRELAWRGPSRALKAHQRPREPSTAGTRAAVVRMQSARLQRCLHF